MGMKNLSHEGHKLNHLLPPRKSQVARRNTRSNNDCSHNFYSKTSRFKNSPILYAVNIFNNSQKWEI